MLSPQALHDLGLGLLSGLQALVPWHYALKRIGGQFGSSVLSYFLFLKTLLAFNALLLLPLLAFLVGVQTAFPPAPQGPVPTFTGLELLTGGVRARGIGPEGHPLVSPGETPRPPLLLQGGRRQLSLSRHLWGLGSPGWPRLVVYLRAVLVALPWPP